MLSPRALQQGWKEELDSNIGQHKEWITKRKLEAVFDAGLPARELEEEVTECGCSGWCWRAHLQVYAQFIRPHLPCSLVLPACFLYFSTSIWTYAACRS